MISHTYGCRWFNRSNEMLNNKYLIQRNSSGLTSKYARSYNLFSAKYTGILIRQLNFTVSNLTIDVDILDFRCLHSIWKKISQNDEWNTRLLNPSLNPPFPLNTHQGVLIPNFLHKESKMSKSLKVSTDQTTSNFQLKLKKLKISYYQYEHRANVDVTYIESIQLRHFIKLPNNVVSNIMILHPHYHTCTLFNI